MSIGVGGIKIQIFKFENYEFTKMSVPFLSRESFEIWIWTLLIMDM